jgi:hemolysin III
MSEPAAPTDELPHVPLVDEADERVHVEPKPTWRGWIHAGITPVALVAGVVLVALANGAEAKWASAVFALTSLLLFGNSALYHRIDWSPTVKRALKRVDHANIFLLIAGTYTPMSLLALPGRPGIVLLSIVWGVALLGIGFRVFWVGAPRWLYTPIYVALGWVAVFYFGPLLHFGGVAVVSLIVAGGLLYTLGALVYGTKRPNPFPRWFGFHEIFHAFTVLAFAAHYVAASLAVYGVGSSVPS